ncbi:hypothetical protein DAA03_29755, partial [Klebsiella pneumoniae]
AAERVLIVVPETLQHQWLVEMLRRFNLRFSLFDDERYAEAQHLHQPLVLEGFRDHDQHALGGAGEQLLVQDHPGFNGFT